MPTFGEYETVERIHASGVSDIYSARRVDSPAATPTFAVVHFQPFALWNDKKTREEIALFLNRADVQCRAAMASPDHVAPVYTTGVIHSADPAAAPAGAYFVTDLYPRSAQRLLDGRARLPAYELRRLLIGITTPLVEMQKSLERPHGNLHPSNILLTSADMEKAEIFLADPAPDSQASSDAESDLLALGELFYQLVMLRPYEGAGGAPPAREWKRFGKFGDKLRQICNRLLTPATDPAQRNMPAILAQLQVLKILQKAPPKRLAALSAVFVGIALFCLYWFVIRAPREDYREDLWIKLCVSYQTWFEDLTNKLADPRQTSKPGYPTHVLDILKDAGVKLGDQPGDPGPLNPNFVINMSTRDYDKSVDFILVHIPDAAKDPTVAYRTHQATKIMDRIAGYLGSATTELPVTDRWPTLAHLEALSVTFGKHEWNKPAAYLHSAALAVAPKPRLSPKTDGKYDLAGIDEQSAILAAIQADTVATPLEQAYLDLQKQAGALASVPNAHFQAFAKFAEDYLISPSGDATADDFKSLAARLADLKSLANQLSALAAPEHRKVHWDALAADPGYPAPLAPDKLEVPAYQKVLALAADYTELAPSDDPRLAKAGDSSAPDADAADAPALRSEKAWDIRLARLADSMYEVDLDKSVPADIKTKLHAAVAQSASHVLRFWTQDELPQTRKMLLSFDQPVWPPDQPLFPGTAPSPIFLPIQRDRSKLSSEVAAAAAALNQTYTQVDSYRVKPAEWLAARTAEKPPVQPGLPISAALAAAWTAHHDALLAKVRVNPDRLKTWAYRSVREQEFKDLTDRLAALDRAIPATADSLTPRADGAWPEQLAYLQLVTVREALIASLLAQLPFPSDVPAFDDPAFQSSLKERTTAFTTRAADIRKLIADFLLAQDHLNHLYLRPGEPAANDRSYAQLYDPWKAHELLHDPAVTAIIKPVTDRFDHVETVAKETSIANLLAVDSKQTELPLAAWRRMGEVDWTAAAPTLDDELKLEATTRQTLTGEPAPHRQALESELTSAHPQRWSKREDVVTDQADLKNDLDRRAEFGIQDSQLDRREQYNLAILANRAVDAAHPDSAHPDADPKARDQYLKDQKIQPFLDAFAFNPNDSLAKNPAVIALRTQLTKLISAGNQEIVKAGPQLAGWTLQGNPTSDSPLLTYTWTAPPRGPTYKLEFLQLHVADRAVYLAATPVTLGLFSDALAANNKTAEIVRAFKKTDSSWTSEGPRGWVLDAGRFRAAPDWLQPDTESPEDTPGHYVLIDKSLTVTAPNEAMPLQRVPPAAALFFSRMLGCRLPTSDEWTAAFQRFEKNAPPGSARDVWNLRDKNFIVQRDFCKSWDNKNKVVFYPDEHIFTPPPGPAANRIVHGKGAEAYTRAALAAIAPNRIAAGPEPYDDSSLFFRSIRADLPAGTPQDLVGNVATYVLNAPEQTVAFKTPGIPIDEAIAAVKADEKSLFVIGGSALSPPEMPFDQPVPVDADGAARKTGYADVGFRLAFTAPIEAIHDGYPRLFKEVALLIPAH